MVGWHHWLNGHEFEQTLGDGKGQRSLVCCSPWGRNGSDTERLNWLTGTVARVGSRIRPLTQRWNHTLVSAALQVPKARRACSSAQRKKSVAFSGTATLRADFPRTRKSEDNGLASVKCWKTKWTTRNSTGICFIDGSRNKRKMDLCNNYKLHFNNI